MWAYSFDRGLTYKDCTLLSFDRYHTVLVHDGETTRHVNKTEVYRVNSGVLVRNIMDDELRGLPPVVNIPEEIITIELVRILAEFGIEDDGQSEYMTQRVLGALRKEGYYVEYANEKRDDRG